MFEKKNLLINCDFCDSRTMKEEDYAQYERIVLNCDMLAVNETSKSILARLPITINQDGTLELPDNVDVTINTVNGDCTIGAGSDAQPNTVLVVNGSLTITPDAGEVLKNYLRIAVNGSVRYPDNLKGLLGILSVNGSTDVYPSDCVLLEKRFVLDKYFPLRARQNGRYYAATRVTVKDPGVDLKKLIEKNVSFKTKTLLTLASKAEDCAMLFDEAVRFIVIPDDMTLIDRNVTLDAALLKKHGTRLFIYGDVKLDDGFEETDKLIVKGDVSLKKAQREAFDALDAEYDGLKILPDGRILQNAVRVKIDKAILDNSPDGIFVRNTAKVVLDPALTPMDILDKIRIENCAKVSCTEEQESAVAAIGTNIAMISDHPAESSDEENSVDPMKLMKDVLHTKIINADNYSL